MGVFNTFLKELATGDSVRDYQHASRLFVGDNFRLAPKMGYLYHVYFDLDSTITRLGTNEQIEAGMLVKSVDLPKFSIDTKNLNSYNKPNLVQTKVKYDNINISFHDDHADVVRQLWFDYYHYYYRDADLGYADASGAPNPAYYKSSKYDDRATNKYGYNPREYSAFTSGGMQQFIKAIRIYSLHQRRFSEYTLINPIIVSFRHGQHQAGSSEPMANEMTIMYENVLYATGWTGKNTVKGFAEIHYDPTPSPLTPAGGGTRSILGPGGMVDTTNDVVNDMAKGDYAAAVFKTFRGANNLRSMNVKAAAGAELKSLGMDILRGNNPLNRLAIPTLGGVLGAGATANLGKTGFGTAAIIPTISATSNGTGVATSGKGAAIAGTALAGLGASVLMKSGSTGGLLATAGLVAGAGALNKLINVNPTTGAVDSVSTLPTETAAQQRVSSIPGAATNQWLNGYVATAGAGLTGLAAVREGADGAALKNLNDLADNQATTVANLMGSTSTPPVPEALQTAVDQVTQAANTVNTTAAELTAKLESRSADLEQNNANLNDDYNYSQSTDQGDVGEA